MDSLLIRIASTAGSRQSENIASAALVYILQSDPRVAAAFGANIARRAGVPISEAITFRGQMHSSGMGVTDISGIVDGAEVVVVEAKISAGLGLGQIPKYVKRVDGGVVAIMAPHVRISAVFADACRQCSVGAPVDDLRVAVGKTILIGLSWEDALSGIAALPLSAGLAGEVAQVETLYRQLERATFVPWSHDDLSVGTARLLASVDDQVEAVVGRLRKDKRVRFKLSALRGGGRFFGAGGELFEISLPIWFGRHTTHWLTWAETPFWVHLQTSTTDSDRVLAAFQGRSHTGAGPAYRRPGGKTVYLPLYAPLGESSQEVVGQLVNATVDAAGTVISLGVSGGTSAHDEDLAQLIDSEDASPSA